jgi:hypothetical protein
MHASSPTAYRAVTAVAWMSAASDVVFMPRGADHALADRVDTPLTETAHPSEPRVIDGPGARSTLLCGAYDLGRAHTLTAVHAAGLPLIAVSVLPRRTAGW